MQINFDQQDLFDAICVASAGKHNDLRANIEWKDTQPDEVVVSIGFEEGPGFWAVGEVREREYRYNEHQFFEAIKFYLREKHMFNRDQLEIELNVEDGVHSAIIGVLR